MLGRGPRRVGLLALVLLVVSVAAAACATPTAPQLAPSSGGQINAFRTPDPHSGTPTPAFPGFTVGAWPSNYSPANNEHMKIYVLCRNQPKDMSQPPTPAQGIAVDIYIGAPVNKEITDAGGQKPVTGSDGLAVGEFDLIDPQSGVPVDVTVTVNTSAGSFTAVTFFTPNPTAAPTPTPNPKASPSPSATGSPSPTP